MHEIEAITTPQSQKRLSYLLSTKLPEAEGDLEAVADKEQRFEAKELRQAAHVRPAAPFIPNKRVFRSPTTATAALPPVTVDGKWCRNYAETGLCSYGTACRWAATHDQRNLPKLGARSG
jgi:hypothetical protein